MKFCIRVAFPDVISHANFSDRRFTGLWGAGSNFLPLSVDLVLSEYVGLKSTL